MKHRAYRGKPAAAAGITGSVLILLLGLALGAASKRADGSSVLLGELTSHIALWVLLASAVALASRSPLKAGLNVLLLLGGMVAAYYAAAELLGGVWSKDFLMGWGVAALLSPIPGFLVWYARGKDWWAWLISTGVVAVQVAATIWLYEKLGPVDLAVVVLTAVLLFGKKVKHMGITRRRRRRRR